MKAIFLFIKKFFVFISISIIIYIIGIVAYGEFLPKYLQQNIFYEQFAYGFSNSRFKEAKKVEDIDILFLGSSRAYRHYDPRIFMNAGFKTFNLGSSSQTFLQTEVLVDRYIENLNPKYVVLDIYPTMFNSDGIEASTDLVSNDLNDWQTFKMSFATKNAMVINTWIFALYNEYFHNSLGETENLIQGKNTYINGGYVERKIEKIQNQKSLKQNWIFDELQIKPFEKVINKLKSKNIGIFVVHSPRHKLITYQNNPDIKAFLEKYNLEYYDFKELKEINDSLHFYDMSHMNQDGVKIYNTFLINRLFNEEID